MTMHGLNKLVYPVTLTPKNAEDCIIRPSSDGGCFMASTAHLKTRKLLHACKQVVTMLFNRLSP